jgi:hypothetical protein
MWCFYFEKKKETRIADSRKESDEEVIWTRAPNGGNY